MYDLVLIGASSLCEEIQDSIVAINDKEPTWNVVGVLDDDAGKHGSACAGHEVLGGRDLIERLDLATTRFLIAFSSPETFLQRPVCVRDLQTRFPAIQFANIVDPAARVSPSASLGEGVFLGPGTVVGSHARVGNHCIAIYNTVISRFVSIGDYTFLSSTVNITGAKSIGENCYLGVNTTINADVGDSVLLSAGCLVTQEVASRAIVFNRPQQQALDFDSTDDMKTAISSLLPS